MTHKPCGLFVITLFIWTTILVSSPGFAKDAVNEIKMPETVIPGLQHLLALVESSENLPLDIQKAGSLVDFVDAPKEPSTLYYAETENPKGPSSYFEFNIQRDLAHILKLYYNPDIPAAVGTPSSIRLSYWKEIRGRSSLPRLWQALSGLTDPVIIRGIEHEEITPDQFSGAYYKYDLERALVLFKHKGRNIFLSLSKQVDVSDVGRKGLVLKPDDDWNYIYSGEKGLMLAGLGWVDSYMYDSFNILILAETTPGGPLVKCGVVKWLRAGWKSLNMVKKKHIFSGQQRYARAVKTITGHPQFPGIDALTREYDRLNQLSIYELRANMRPYLDRMKQRLANENSVRYQWAIDLLDEEQYLNRLSKREMTATLMMEYMKASLGKNRSVPEGSLAHLKTDQPYGRRMLIK